jgi:DNA-binding NarL/FixJ family response regulator
MVRILVVDEQALYRTGLRVVISAALPDADLVEAADLDGMMQLLMGPEPIDLALVSLSLTTAADPLIIRDFKRASPATHYVIISTECSFDQILRYLAEGFHGFISKLQREDEIVESVLEVLSGRLSVPQALMPSAKTSERPLSRSASARHRWTRQQNQFGLTPRQKDVLALLADGLSNREIAQALHIAEPTTKIHVSALMRVLNVRNRTEAAILAASLLRTIDAGRDRKKTARNKKP